MIVVIISGGSGTRLWPLSTPDFPKHLLKLTGERSLLQASFDRARLLTESDRIFVVPEVSHAQHAISQLPELAPENIIVEPGRRGTANCLLLALSVIRKRGLPADEPIFIGWADHYITDVMGFADTFHAAERIARTEDKIVDIGVVPTYASTGLGYIERGEKISEDDEAYRLAQFKEKPDLTTAQSFVETGNYYWNTGYLVGSMGAFERDFEKYAPEMWKHYQQLLTANGDSALDTYLGFEQLNLERTHNEKNPDMLVMPGRFDWADVGSHGDLHDISVHDSSGNTIHGAHISIAQTNNSMVRNETNVPVAVIGMEGVVVIANEHGVLVTDKHHAQHVGDVAKSLYGL